MDEWKITRDRKGCDRPGCPLPSARHYFAVLEFPACVRRELCDGCFVDLERRTPEPLVFWRALRQKSGSKEPVLDLASLRILFDRLGTVDDDRARSLRYFCALLLLRKRVLRMVAPRTAEQERADLVVVDPKQKEMPPISLFAPAIDHVDLGVVKDELLAAIGEDPDGKQSEPKDQKKDARAASGGGATPAVEGASESVAAQEPVAEAGAAEERAEGADGAGADGAAATSS